MEIAKKRMQTCCFTGHRHLPLEEQAEIANRLRKYFPKSYTPARMQETIIKLLEQWQKKRQRDQER